MYILELCDEDASHGSCQNAEVPIYIYLFPALWKCLFHYEVDDGNLKESISTCFVQGLEG